MTDEISAENDNSKNNNNCIKNYTCSSCGKTFANFRILGGHFTKAHPKQSDLYNRKMFIRQMRGPLREELKMAKELYD